MWSSFKVRLHVQRYVDLATLLYTAAHNDSEQVKHDARLVIAGLLHKLADVLRPKQ